MYCNNLGCLRVHDPERDELVSIGRRSATEKVGRIFDQILLHKEDSGLADQSRPHRVVKKKNKKTSKITYC